MRSVSQRRSPPLPLAGQRPNSRPPRRTAERTGPIPGGGSDIMFHHRSRAPCKALHGSIGPLRTERRQPIGTHRGITTALQGDITHLGIVHRTSQNVPSFTPVERPMPIQNAAAAHTRMCVLHREKGQCAPTPLGQHSAGRLRGCGMYTKW